jgi:YidC/Oxa1 family membrane protein insertase
MGISHLFHVAFYQPMFNGLVATVATLPGHDLGLAIVVLTVVIRFILVWPSISQIRSTRSTQELQPKLKALQKEFSGNRQELAKRTMELYRQHKINPFSSCLMSLIQLPFIFALYQVFVSGIHIDPTTHLLDPARLNELYGPLRHAFEHSTLSTLSFGFLDITKKGNIILAVIVGITAYYQTKMLIPKQEPPKVKGAEDEGLQSAMMRQMTYFSPLIMTFFTWSLPSGIGLYFLTSNVFSFVQQWLILRHDGKKLVQQP